jgi:hypothetical protein
MSPSRAQTTSDWARASMAPSISARAQEIIEIGSLFIVRVPFISALASVFKTPKKIDQVNEKMKMIF